MELFQTVWSKDSSMVSSSWSFEATEVFKRLTEDAQKLVGFLVPWDSQMMNNIVNYCQGLSRNMGGPEGIWVCRREYGWAGGNMVGHEIILSNLGGPLIIFVEMDGL